MSRWREYSRHVIREVIERVGTADLEGLEKEIRAAYPFGQRAMHPYKIWLDEVRKTLIEIRGLNRLHDDPYPPESLFGRTEDPCR